MRKFLIVLTIFLSLAATASSFKMRGFKGIPWDSTPQEVVSYDKDARVVNGVLISQSKVGNIKQIYQYEFTSTGLQYVYHSIFTGMATEEDAVKACSFLVDQIKKEAGDPDDVMEDPETGRLLHWWNANTDMLVGCKTSSPTALVIGYTKHLTRPSGIEL